MRPDRCDLPADYARCNGRIAVNDTMVPCERRDSCARWLAAPAIHKRCCMVLVAGIANVKECEYYVAKTDGDVPRAAQGS